jgi:hypothetical protein
MTRHHVNASPVWLVIKDSPWISTETKVRLLQWKIRMDLMQYAARACPPLSVDRIASYKPKDPSGKSAHGRSSSLRTTGTPRLTSIEILSRVHNLDDDGHIIKLGRASAICHEVSRKYEDKGWLLLKGDDLWLKIYHLIVESAEEPGQRWVRTTGLEEAWKDIPSAD